MTRCLPAPRLPCPTATRSSIRRHPERSPDQRIDALNMANEIRTRRAQLKRDLKAGRTSIATLLLDPPAYLQTAEVRQQITDLPLYPEDRSCTTPTATRVFDHLAPIQRHHLIRDRHTVQTFEPQLTPLQAQLLDLLAVPASAYTSQP